MLDKNKADNAFSIVRFFWILTLVFILGVLCIWDMPSFDGSMNLQVVKNLLENGKYMTTYNGGIIFDEVIQTRLPVLLPIYFLWLFTGESSIAALAVNALYVLLLAAGVFSLGNKLGAKKITGTAICAVICMTNFFWKYSMGIYGEIPTLALLIWSVIFLIKFENENKKIYIFYAGVLYSLAYLNKTVILIALPSYIIVFVYKAVVEKKLNLKEIGLFLLGFLIPCAAYEIFHIIQVGGFAVYSEGYSNEFSKILQQAGIKNGFSDTNNLWDKFWIHLSILKNDFFAFVPGIFVILLLIVVFAAAMYYFIKKRLISFYGILFLTAYSYFGWWLIITPTEKAYDRRILIGIILLEMTIGFCLEIFFKNKDKFRKIFVALCLVTVFAGIISNVYTGISFDKDKKDRVIAVANEISKIKEDNPDSIFYGVGWWQAPTLSFYSGVDFYDFNHVYEIPDNSYLVVDESANMLADEQIYRALNGYRYTLEKIIEKDNNCVYKIIKADIETFNYKSQFENIDKSQIELTQWDRFMDYEYISGVYDLENDDHRWASGNVEILLGKSESGNLYIKGYMPDINKLSTDFKLYLFVNNKLADSFDVLDNGNFEINCNVKDYVNSNDCNNIRLVSSSLVISEDARELAYVLDEIGFD